jgi:outer membrane protein assembly complex protein YaeT
MIAAQAVRAALVAMALLLVAAPRARAQDRAPGREDDTQPPEHFERQDGRVIRQLKFEGNKAIDAATLAASIATTNSSFFATSFLFRWLGLGEKRYLNETELQRDVERLRVLYKRSGYPDIAVDTLIRRTETDAFITFRLHEGEPVRITRLDFTGLDSVPERGRRQVLLDLPLKVGDPFNRYLLQTAIDSITGRLRDHGYPAADVFREFTSDLGTHTATVTLHIEPGRRSVIGPVRVEGAVRVDSAVARKLLVTRPGRRFSETELFESQRALYDSDLYQVASVDIDSAVYERGDSVVPIVVRVSESRPLRVRSGIGYATTDCFRGGAAVTARNFLGQGRLLDVSTRVSKVGVGRPADFGLADNLCGASRDDSVGSAVLNYNVTAQLRRPAFISPRNTLALSVYAERRSEFKVYLRDEVGASVNITRQTPRRRLPLSLTYTLSYGRTDATDVNFCGFFNACTPDIITLLRQRRLVAVLTGIASIPRANSFIDPSRGSNKSLEVAFGSRFIGSSRLQEFTRVVGDASWYRPLARDVVLATHLRAGVIFAPRADIAGETNSFVPPEQRFYGGGPNDIRGFQRNELGPVVYVVTESALEAAGSLDSVPSDSILVSATGGNAVAVANAELRFPSPVFRNRLRLAAFVDAGTVFQRGSDISPRRIVVTPGIGFRVTTPLGPARLDIAYNGYSLQSGPLYEASRTGELLKLQDDFLKARTGNFTFHFAVGQPF